MHQQKGKKILFYLFLFIIVGSINNTVLSNIKFESIKKIKVSGLHENENMILLQDIEGLNLKNIFFADGNDISNIISSHSLVEEYEIFKKYPSTLNIKIQKTKFLAKMRNNGKIFLVGSNGKLSDIKFSEEKVPFIFGKPEINEFLKFKDIVDQSKFSLNEIKNLYFFPSKRWDLELKNNIILKLSREHAQDSLDQAFEILNDKKFINIKVVDARVKNQIILND